MSRKVCAAGVVGPYSYIILNTEDGVISSIDDKWRNEHVSTTHVDMTVAEHWVDRFLTTHIGKDHEVN